MNTFELDNILVVDLGDKLLSFPALEWELTRRPRCGLCAFYPITQGGSYECPIYGKKVWRFNRPRRTTGGRVKPYYCFQPMTELAYEKLMLIKREMKNERNKLWMRTHQDVIRPARLAWRGANREHLAELARARYHRNPEPQKERNWWRTIITYYDPLTNIKRNFYHARVMEKRKGLPFETHIELEDLKQIQILREDGVLGSQPIPLIRNFSYK